MRQDLEDSTEIRDLIERWVVYRDARIWDKFRPIWHPEGTMKATWSESTFEEFIARTDEGTKHGLNILHNLGGSAVEVKGNRAVSMTKFVILQRAEVEGVLCDVSCWARHYDMWEKRGGRWGLVSRETITEKDRIDPVDSAQPLRLDPELLGQFPMEYRHLAYLQTKSGYTVNKDVPRLSGGPALEALYKRGETWLEGKE